jgi:hypothetical protein
MLLPQNIVLSAMDTQTNIDHVEWHDLKLPIYAVNDPANKNGVALVVEGDDVSERFALVCNEMPESIRLRISEIVDEEKDIDDNSVFKYVKIGEKQFYVPGENSTISTDRNIGENSNDFDIRKGAFLSPKINKNIYEFLVMPQPQFFVAEYEVTIWVQYFEHMNEILDKLMSSYFAPAQRTLKVDTAKGYWFVAYFDGSYTIEDNADSNAGEETIRKCSISVKIPGYTFASKSPGVPLAIRRYVSAPVVNFGFGISQSDTEFEVVDRGEVVTQETPEFNLGERVVARDNLTQVDLETTESLATTDVDITSGKSQVKYKKVSYKNKNKGESIVNLDVFNGPLVVTYKK